MSTLHVENLKGPTSGANANKITIPTGQTLSAPGHVIQVQQGIMTARQTVTGGSMVDVGSNFEVTITPASTSSKILVQTMLGGIFHRHELINSRLRRAVAGGSTTNINLLGWYNYTASNEWSSLTIAHNYLDSPNTTSACTYKLQVGTELSAVYYINYNNTQLGGTQDDSRSTITALEIAG